MKTTVVITSELPAIALEILSQQSEVIVHPSDGIRTEEELMTILSEADGAITLLTDPVTRRVLESSSNLTVVANYAVGTNNIDLSAARDCGVTITNTPGVLTDSTADLTIALILAVTRRIVEGDQLVRSGRFRGWQPLMLLGASLSGRQIGIVGMGRIGAAVARRCVAFGMRVIYHSRHACPEMEAELGAVRLDLEALLSTSDVVSLHVPLTGDTRHLIDERMLARMRPSAYLINTSRGPVVDENALVSALKAGKIAGAALDVYEAEPSVQPGLLSLSNVVLLPHLGSATVETRTEMARMAARDVALVLQGFRPEHGVD